MKKNEELLNKMHARPIRTLMHTGPTFFFSWVDVQEPWRDQQLFVVKWRSKVPIWIDLFFFSKKIYGVGSIGRFVEKSDGDKQFFPVSDVEDLLILASFFHHVVLHVVLL